MALRTIHPINEGWQFKKLDQDDAEFLHVAQFPTNIHLDLLHHELIPDPFIGKNELDVQWVGETVWVYRTTFSSPHVDDGCRAVMAFDGLDTFATVALNGRTILKTENMFIPERVDVTEFLNMDAPNEMVITFDCAYLRGWELVEKYPDHKWGCWNGDNSRLAVRKAQYHWGWDWGPTLLTCGPWRPINLELYSARISDLHAQVSLNDSLSHATVKVTTQIEGNASYLSLVLALRGQAYCINMEAAETVEATFELDNPQLWYPMVYGDQPLYTLIATISASDKKTALDTTSKRIGLRKVKLVQQPLVDQPGTSFFFKVNNVPIFCGGSDWIPADNFIPRISKKRYHDWVNLVARGNQFMIRVWGGGLYEEQAFYDACDEIGVLVWQDFMFGCGNYPCWPELLQSIEREATENVKLLRHHPSIVIWAGNNEDYQYAESVKLTYDLEDKDPDNWLKTDFPARYIYEKILSDVCNALVPDTYYHPGSPWSGSDTTDPTRGDLHQWNVWHGSQEKYQDFDKLIGRFVSEFGMEAFPSIKTIDAYLPKGKDDPDRYPQSSTVDFHNKADGHERRIALYLVENLQYSPEPLEYFVYCTQLMQAECLASAYRLWKRQWKGPGREYCGGALVWQINDCWPVTSWAICDYYLRPKLAYFAIKREMAPWSVGMKRVEHVHSRDKYTRVNIEKKAIIEVWGSNLSLATTRADCIVKAWNVETGHKVFEKTVASDIALEANMSTEIASLEVPAEAPGHEGRTVVAAYLYRGREQLARHVNWPEPLKYVHLQQHKALSVAFNKEGTVLTLNSDVPLKGVSLEGKSDDVRFEDNCLDLVPGETVPVNVSGVTLDTQITVQYLGLAEPITCMMRAVVV